MAVGHTVEPEDLIQTDEIGYLHERIDQLIRQVSLEVGLADVRQRVPLSRQDQTHVIDVAKNRFRWADDAAADKYRRPHRELS